MEFPPKKPGKNRKVCCVYGCNSVANKQRSIRFHLFPIKGEKVVFVKNKLGDSMACDKLRAWKRVLKISEKITANTFVCSLHFSASDYKPTWDNKKQRYLKSTAVPNCNLPSTPVHGTAIQSPTRKQNRQKLYDERHRKRESYVTQLFPETEEDKTEYIRVMEHDISVCPSTSVLDTTHTKLSVQHLMNIHEMSTPDNLANTTASNDHPAEQKMNIASSAQISNNELDLHEEIIVKQEPVDDNLHEKIIVKEEPVDDNLHEDIIVKEEPSTEETNIFAKSEDNFLSHSSWPPEQEERYEPEQIFIKEEFYNEDGTNSQIVPEFVNCGVESSVSPDSECSAVKPKDRLELLSINDKISQCKICNKVFLDKYSLGMHLVIHANFRKHECPFCKKIFNCKSRMIKHSKLHTATRDFKCTICYRAFKQMKYLKQHEKVHSGTVLSDPEDVTITSNRKVNKTKATLPFNVQYVTLNLHENIL